MGAGQKISQAVAPLSLDRRPGSGIRQAGLRSRDEADTGHGSGTLELYPRPRSPDVFESAAVGERVLSDLSAVRRWVPLSSESDGRHGCAACVCRAYKTRLPCCRDIPAVHIAIPHRDTSIVAVNTPRQIDGRGAGVITRPRSSVCKAYNSPFSPHPRIARMDDQPNNFALEPCVRAAPPSSPPRPRPARHPGIPPHTRSSMW